MNEINIKNLRKKLGFSQEKLAETLGVSRRTIQNWEEGLKIPKSKSAILLKLQSGNIITSEISKIGIKERLLSYLTIKNYWHIDFCHLIDKPVSYIMGEEDVSLSPNELIIIANKFPDLSINWLLTGTGESIIRENSSQLLQEIQEIKKELNSLRIDSFTNSRNVEGAQVAPVREVI